MDTPMVKEVSALYFADPHSAGFYFLWYAGVDVNKRPDFARAAAANGHVSEKARKVAEKFMDLTVLPEAFRDAVKDTDHLQTTQPIELLAEYMEPFLTNASFAPLMASDLSGLPPALILTCEFDFVRDDGALYVHRIKQAG
ncbi:hypothetical protein PENTCL1PPCAC_14817, partial [Pristionchus entomophagus]